MYETFQRLDFFSKLIYCSSKINLWTYQINGELYSSTDNANELWEQFFLLEDTKAYAFDHIDEVSFPLVLTNSLNMIWAASIEKEDGQSRYLHVIGPVFTDDVSIESMRKRIDQYELPLKLKKTFLNEMNLIPIVPLTSFLNYGIMLHYSVTGEEISIHQFSYQTALNESENKQYSTDTVKRHGTWATEQIMTKLVEEGNLNYQSVLRDIFASATIGKLSLGDPLRQTKNMIISGIIIVSRAALRAGLFPDIAYTLSDIYIQSVEGCTSISEVMNIHETMMQDFVQRVHEMKSSALSTFVKKCHDYISVYIYEDFSLDDIAGFVGYTPYYLSRKYKEETGQDIRLYIRNIRLDLAKDLLQYSNESIHEISGRLHFCSQSYFSQHFKARFGMTPKEFRSSL